MIQSLLGEAHANFFDPLAVDNRQHSLGGIHDREGSFNSQVFCRIDAEKITQCVLFCDDRGIDIGGVFFLKA